MWHTSLNVSVNGVQTVKSLLYMLFHSSNIFTQYFFDIVFLTLSLLHLLVLLLHSGKLKTVFLVEMDFLFYSVLLFYSGKINCLERDVTLNVKFSNNATHYS